MSTSKYWKAIRGFIVCCAYCGEQCGNSQKFCALCKTVEGRKKIFEANKEIITQLREKGYCKGTVYLKDPSLKAVVNQTV